MRILVVDDEAAIRESVAYALAAAGFGVDEAATGARALELFEQTTYDLILLDVMLGDASGMDICRELRAESAVPVIMLTARDAEVDRDVGLELGADDYVTKPFSMSELVSRIRALLRRRELDRGEREAIIRAGDVEIDLRRHEVTVGGEPVLLTPTELRILVLLASEDRPFTRREILRSARGTPYVPDERACDVHVGNLRAKLGRDRGAPERLVTVRGVGYRLTRS
jgi:two-component system response regulator RegX3